RDPGSLKASRRRPQAKPRGLGDGTLSRRRLTRLWQLNRQWKDQLDFRFRLSRLAFAATFLRYCSTNLSPEAPAIRLVPAFAAASIFSLTIRWVSRWAAL